jgi:hypothetical protein
VDQKLARFRQQAGQSLDKPVCSHNADCIGRSQPGVALDENRELDPFGQSTPGSLEADILTYLSGK